MYYMERKTTKIYVCSRCVCVCVCFLFCGACKIVTGDFSSSLNNNNNATVRTESKLKFEQKRTEKCRTKARKKEAKIDEKKTTNCTNGRAMQEEKQHQLRKNGNFDYEKVKRQCFASFMFLFSSFGTETGQKKHRRNIHITVHKRTQSNEVLCDFSYTYVYRKACIHLQSNMQRKKTYTHRIKAHIHTTTSFVSS